MTLSPSADQFLLSGTFNFRDVGGLRTGNGARLRPGVLLRSAELSGLGIEGHATLRELGVTDVHDLRGHDEIAMMGTDTLPDAVRLHITPFDTRMGDTPPHEAAAARTHMLEVYRFFPALPEAHAAIRAIADSITADSGTALVHCAAGKDRTGWAVATLLHAVGVTDDDIFADYLLSNAAIAPLRASMAAKLPAGANLSDDLLGVRTEYLQAAMNTVQEQYGGFESYLPAIGLTEDRQDELRTRLLVS